MDLFHSHFSSLYYFLNCSTVDFSISITAPTSFSRAATTFLVSFSNPKVDILLNIFVRLAISGWVRAWGVLAVC